MMVRTTSLTALLTAVTLAVNVAPAFAGATSSGYDETGVLGDVPSTSTNAPSVLGAQATRGTGQAPASVAAATATAPVTAAQSLPSSGEGGGSLPFTGFDAGIVLLLGAVLVGTGIVIRRSSRRSTS
jgi:hypothetical protein